MPRGMRFGLCTDQNLPFATLVERWQHFERLGFDSVWDCDHFNQPSRPTGPYYEGWTLLAALAARTSSIRVGVLVSCNTFRHPGLLAHEAMTVDHVSNGRLELGLGAGWFVPEHEQFGIPLPAARGAGRPVPRGRPDRRRAAAPRPRHVRREVLPADETPTSARPRSSGRARP